MTTARDARYDILFAPARIWPVATRNRCLIDRGARMRGAIEGYLGVR
jgi:hypothetical protein